MGSQSLKEDGQHITLTRRRRREYALATAVVGAFSDLATSHWVLRSERAVTQVKAFTHLRDTQVEQRAEIHLVVIHPPGQEVLRRAGLTLSEAVELAYCRLPLQCEVEDRETI